MTYPMKFCKAILRELAKNIKDGEYFGIILDETSDVSSKEQISFCFRIMDEDFNIEELFFDFYATEITSSGTIFSIMEDVLIRMQFPIHQCRGQSYDGAANMSGFVNGLRTRVEEIEKRAVYVHCRAHKLHLAVQAMSSSKEIRDVMALIQDLIAFISGSPKRLAWFAHFQNDDTGAERKSLRPFCPTRWTMQLVSLQAITSNYSAISIGFKR